MSTPIFRKINLPWGELRFTLFFFDLLRFAQFRFLEILLKILRGLQNYE